MIARNPDKCNQTCSERNLAAIKCFREESRAF